MLDYDLLARCRTMLADEATTLHTGARDIADINPVDAISEVIVAEACSYAADALHNVLSKADAFLDDEQAREALKR
jgi:hypothetical protein